jgi:hypothetical protein
MAELHAVQKEWLSKHPRHERWHPLPFIGLDRWTDHIWVLPDGREVTEEPRWMNWGGLQMVSAADTLWVDPIILHAARKYYAV